MEEKVLVSIICITYNHERFIRRCMEGFLMQKTDFLYEIIIHDDASTDGTTDIILEYQDRYPELIRAFIEKENQYSKGILCIDEMHRQAKGKYLAFCNGDDYWIDDRKLQMQIDYMEEHEECSMTMHNAYCVYPYEKNDGKFRPVLSTFEEECDTDFKMQFQAGISATSSFVYRRELILGEPEFFREAPTRDDAMRYYLALHGAIHYFDRVMSIRNALYGSSWNDRIKNDFKMQCDYVVGYLNFFKKFDRYTNSVYARLVKEKRKGVLYTLYNWLSQEETGSGECIQKIQEINKRTGGEFADETKNWISRLNDGKKDYLKETMDISLLEGKRVYVYGAGKYGKICAMQLEDCGIKIQGHVISDGQDGSVHNNNGRLYYISELNSEEEDVFVVIGVGKKNIQPVMHELEIRGVDFYWPNYN